MVITIVVISPNQNIPNHLLQMSSPPSLVHHCLHRCHLPQLLQVGRVDALEELVVCGGQADSDHPPVPSHVRLVRGGALRWCFKDGYRTRYAK